MKKLIELIKSWFNIFNSIKNIVEQELEGKAEVVEKAPAKKKKK